MTVKAVVLKRAELDLDGKKLNVEIIFKKDDWAKLKLKKKLKKKMEILVQKT